MVFMKRLLKAVRILNWPYPSTKIEVGDASNQVKVQLNGIFAAGIASLNLTVTVIGENSLFERLFWRHLA
jgi:hypothetical protein